MALGFTGTFYDIEVLGTVQCGVKGQLSGFALRSTLPAQTVPPMSSTEKLRAAGHCHALFNESLRSRCLEQVSRGHIRPLLLVWQRLDVKSCNGRMCHCH